MDNIKPLSEMLKLKRKEKGYSLRTLANRTNLSHTYINQLEKDEVKEPSFGTLYKLSSVLNFDCSPYVSDQDMLDLIREEIEKNNNKESTKYENLYNKISYILEEFDFYSPEYEKQSEDFRDIRITIEDENRDEILSIEQNTFVELGKDMLNDIEKYKHMRVLYLIKQLKDAE